jgi:transcriptional regulator with XRE-family HTH domain
MCSECTPTPNKALEHALVDDPRQRREIAAAVGVSAQTFSGVVTGRVKPSASLRARIALALGIPEDELFPAKVPA